jgi:Spy/CpxP family protein refolding chaperone
MKKLELACALAALLFSVAFANPVLAQTDTTAMEDHLRQVQRKVKQKRDSAVSTLIELTDEQEKVFRSIQKDYDKDQKQLAKKDRALIREFAEIHDQLDAESASSLGQRFFDLRRERLEVQERYLKRLSDEISPVAAVLFIQLQRRFEAEIEMERMKYLPLAE